VDAPITLGLSARALEAWADQFARDSGLGAASRLSWWGPVADSRNTQQIASACAPILLLSATSDSNNDTEGFAELKAAAIRALSVTEILYEDLDHGLAGVERKVADDLCDWLTELGVIA
jgi:alpha-beta hydrolase superfamily lysophospholipase